MWYLLRIQNITDWLSIHVTYIRSCQRELELERCLWLAPPDLLSYRIPSSGLKIVGVQKGPNDGVHSNWIVVQVDFESSFRPHATLKVAALDMRDSVRLKVRYRAPLYPSWLSVRPQYILKSLGPDHLYICGHFTHTILHYAMLYHAMPCDFKAISYLCYIIWYHGYTIASIDSLKLSLPRYSGSFHTYSLLTLR